MDKETKWFIDTQLECVNKCKGVNQSRINKIFKTYIGLDIYYMLINYEIELIKNESIGLMRNNLKFDDKELNSFDNELKIAEPDEWKKLFKE